jgi:hypothetical protein
VLIATPTSAAEANEAYYEKPVRPTDIAIKQSAYNHGIMGYHTPNIDLIAKEGASLNAANINYMTLKAVGILKRLQELETMGHPNN